MKALFLTDAEARALYQILRTATVNVSGGQGWMKQSSAGKEMNYTHGKLMELTKRCIRKQEGEDAEPDPFEVERERDLCIKRERMAAKKLALRALHI